MKRYLLVLIVSLFSVALGFAQDDFKNRVISIIKQSAGNSTTNYSASQNYPQETQIRNDLIGHYVTEGTDNGYYDSSWKWRIEHGEIRSFQIYSVEQSTNDRYTIDANIRLATTTVAYDADVTIYYVKSSGRWQIEFVRSNGLQIVRTYRYDRCVRTSIESGWITLRNDCDVPLEVGFTAYSYGAWKKYSLVVQPHDSNGGGPGFADVVIDYVERP